MEKKWGGRWVGAEEAGWVGVMLGALVMMRLLMERERGEVKARAGRGGADGRDHEKIRNN